MKKLTIAEKLARKAFQGAAMQRSWQVHESAFGPLLTGSFQENYLAKTHLCAALNFISRRESEAGRKKLAELTGHLETPMDHCAFHFFTGLSHEAEGNRDQALVHYRESCRQDPGFYMPFLKYAKLAQDARAYETAAESYRKAISLAPTPVHEAVFHTNLCGCLTCMKQFEEARAHLMRSRELAPVQPGRDAVAAIYYASTGDGENAGNCLSRVEKDTPALYHSTKTVVERILAGEDPAAVCP